MATGKAATQTPIWIVIADGGRARIVVRAAHDRGFETIRSFDAAAAHQSSAALGSERPGRTGERASGLRHAIEPRADRHQQAKEVFAELVADTINQAAGRGEFLSFVLIAPTRLLPTIRDGLDARARDMLVGSLAKDLTKVPDGDLPAHLTGVWPPSPR